MSVIEFFQSFLIIIFFNIPVSSEPEKTTAVRIKACWNIFFCDSNIEEVPKTGSSIENPRTCNSLFS